VIDPILIKEHAGFQSGKFCTGQLLNLTHIEDGFQEAFIAGAVFVDLSVAYDTVNHLILLQKLLHIMSNLHLMELVRIPMENRQFFVKLSMK